jgi:serine/threonine-protein kinase
MSPLASEIPDPRRTCPDRTALRAFLLGTLPNHALEAIADHLTGCPRCGTALPELDRADPVLVELRKHLRGSGPPGADAGPTADSDAATVVGLANGRPIPPPDTGLVGKLVGPYLLLERLGAGGMGVVYKARHERLGRVVALKLLPHGALIGGELLHRFRTEAAAVARLNHPNIVRLYESDETADGPYFSMEFVGGDSLARKLAAGPLPPRDAAVLVEALARAVQCAHEQDVIHRDIKPSNIFLTTDSTPKLGDFGLAKLVDATDGLTRTHDVFGTLAYMSPEQAAGDTRNVREAADIYSLGAVLYETLAGVQPFRGPRQRVLEAIASKPPAPPSRRTPALAPELEAICLKCLEKDPARRYGTAAEMADDLKAWLEGRPTKARPPGWPRKLGRALARHKRICAAVCLLAASLGMIGAAMWWRDPERPRNELKSQLSGGREIHFRGSEPLPGPFHWAIGDEPKLEQNKDEGSFSFTTLGTSLLELVDDPMCSHYRLSADIRQDDVAGVGDVGLFVGLRRMDVNGEARCQFYTVGFAVNGGGVIRSQQAGKPNIGTVRLHNWFGPPGDCSRTVEIGDTFPFDIVPALEKRNPWHHLAVEVSPDYIKSFWRKSSAEDVTAQNVTETELSRVLTQAVRAKPMLADALQDIQPRSGLGIYANRSKVSIRNVTLEPLP